MNKDYNFYLKKLDKIGIEYCVYGTHGLTFYKKSISKFYTIKDCDIIIKNDQNSIAMCLEIFAQWDAQIYIWDLEYKLPIDQCQLKGKFYIRCKINKLQFDITYEHDYIMTFNEKLYEKHKIKILNEDQILQIKSSTNRDKDVDFIDFYKKLKD